MKRLVIASGLLVAGLVMPPAVTPATAQVVPPERRIPAAQPLQEGVQVRVRGAGAAPGEEGRPAVDESALRYYASRGNRAMVEAEIARLRTLHPGWQPPADLFRPASSVDERPLWDLYQQGDYAAVRGEIERLAQGNPGWEPPQKLLDLMEENEVRARLQTLEEEAAWQELLELAAAKPGQIACAKVDNMWRVARAHEALGARDEAFATYAQIIEQCDDVGHRVATLQKAKGGVSEAQLSQLFKLEDAREKTAAERRQIAELRSTANRSATPRALSRLFERDLTPDAARAAHPAVLQRKDANAAQKLGWFYHDAGRWEEARAWFQRAHAWAPSAKSAEGLARAHAQLGNYGEVEKLARAWPTNVGPMLADLRRERLGRAFERADHAAVLAQTSGADDTYALTMRGWTFMRLARPTEGLLAFEDVLRRDDATGASLREAAYGIAMARLALGNLEQAVAIGEAYHLPDEQKQGIRAQVLEHRAARACEREDYRACVALFEERRSYAEPSRELLIQEAWARYHLGQKNVAARMFARLDRVYSTPETREGLKVIGRSINRVGL